MRCVLFLVVLLFLFSCNADDQDLSASVEIEIRIDGVLPGMPVFLMSVFEGQQRPFDTVMTQADGLIRLKRKAPYPAGYYFIPLPEDQKVPLLLDKDQHFSMKTRLGSIEADMDVEGSLDNELLYDHLKAEEAARRELSLFLREMSRLEKDTDEYLNLEKKRDEMLESERRRLDAVIENHPNSLFSVFKVSERDLEAPDVRLPDGTVDVNRQNFLHRQMFWNNFDFSDPRLLRTPVFPEKLLTFFNRLTAHHPDSIIASSRLLIDQVLEYPEYFKYFTNWITFKYRPGKTTLNDGEAVLVFIVKNYLTSDRVFWADSARLFALHQRIDEMASSLVGQIGPDVKAPDPTGKIRSIYEINAPYVVIFIYNPDCSHCIEETPKLLDFYRKWKKRGVEVYAIAVDTEPETWEDFIDQYKLDWINVFDPSNAAFYGKYYVDNTPEIYLLDQERKIIGKNLKADEIESFIPDSQ